MEELSTEDDIQYVCDQLNLSLQKEEVLYNTENYINSFNFYDNYDKIIINEIVDILYPKKSTHILIEFDLLIKKKKIIVQDCIKVSYPKYLEKIYYLDNKSNRLKCYDFIDEFIHTTSLIFKYKYLVNYCIIDDKRL